MHLSITCKPDDKTTNVNHETKTGLETMQKRICRCSRRGRCFLPPATRNKDLPIFKMNQSVNLTTMTSDYSPQYEYAHPIAKQLMKDDFFFDVIEETAPFGSDDGADTYAAFKDWRKTNASESTVIPPWQVFPEKKHAVVGVFFHRPHELKAILLI